MSEKIREHLKQHCIKNGWGTSEADLIECVTEADYLWQGERDEHRWYTLVPTVVNVDGMLLMFDYCDVRSEESGVEDCIGGYELDDVVEVSPVKKTVTVYEPVVVNLEEKR